MYKILCNLLRYCFNCSFVFIHKKEQIPLLHCDFVVCVFNVMDLAKEKELCYFIGNVLEYL